MKELVKYTMEMDYFDPEKPYNESILNILIDHDNAKESNGEKFKLFFLNAQNEKIPEVILNKWLIWDIKVIGYYTRIKVMFTVRDPKGTNLPEDEFTTGGFSIGIDKETNIFRVKQELTGLLERFRKFSCFMDYRSRLDYVNFYKKNDPYLNEKSYLL